MGVTDTNIAQLGTETRTDVSIIDCSHAGSLTYVNDQNAGTYDGYNGHLGINYSYIDRLVSATVKWNIELPETIDVTKVVAKWMTWARADAVYEYEYARLDWIKVTDSDSNVATIQGTINRNSASVATTTLTTGWDSITDVSIQLYSYAKGLGATFSPAEVWCYTRLYELEVYGKNGGFRIHVGSTNYDFINDTSGAGRLSNGSSTIGGMKIVSTSSELASPLRVRIGGTTCSVASFDFI